MLVCDELKAALSTAWSGALAALSAVAAQPAEAASAQMSASAQLSKPVREMLAKMATAEGLAAVLASGDEDAAERLVKSVNPTMKGGIVSALPPGAWAELSWIERAKLFDGKLPPGPAVPAPSTSLTEDTVLLPGQKPYEILVCSNDSRFRDERLSFDARPGVDDLRSRAIEALERQATSSSSAGLLPTPPFAVQRVTIQMHGNFGFDASLAGAPTEVELTDAAQLDNPLCRAAMTPFLTWPHSGFFRTKGGSAGEEIPIEISYSSAFRTEQDVLGELDRVRLEVRLGRNHWAQDRTSVADGKPIRSLHPAQLTVWLGIDVEVEARQREQSEQARLRSRMHHWERDKLPASLRDVGLLLATGSGAGGVSLSGGGMAWESDYLLYDPSSHEIWIYSFKGSERSGVEMSQPRGPLTASDAFASSEYSDYRFSFTAAGRRLLGLVGE